MTRSQNNISTACSFRHFLLSTISFRGDTDRPFPYGRNGTKNPSVMLGLRCGERADCSIARIRSRAADRGVSHARHKES
jgi:hypothetical protein